MSASLELRIHYHKEAKALEGGTSENERKYYILILPL
jgi:hypothetical protein